MTGPADDHWPLFCEPLAAADPAVAGLIGEEEVRNASTVNLIASESYCPRATVEAEASLLVNKNVYGYPDARGVAGCGVFDGIERLAQARARSLFGAEHANVQSLSSTIGNIAVFRALVPAGGTVLAFDEAAGGHHSHGSPGHISGRDFRIVRFGADEAAGTPDWAAAARLAAEHRPALVVAGATSFPRAIDFAPAAEIAASAGARLFADIAHVSGLVATGLHPNPVPLADVVTTSTHKTLCGPRTGGLVLARGALGPLVDAEIFPGLQGAPGAHIIAARAVLFGIVGTPAFRQLMERVRANAARLAEALRREGVELYLGGTDTHMVVLDLRRGGGSDGLEHHLERHGLLGNAVPLPADPTSGGRGAFRVGTTAMTVRGIGGEAIGEIARILAQLVRTPGEDPHAAARLAEIAAAHPIPAGFLPAWAHQATNRIAS